MHSRQSDRLTCPLSLPRVVDAVIYWFMVASVAKCALGIDLHTKILGVHPFLVLVAPVALQLVFTVVLWTVIPKIQHSITVAGVTWEKEQSVKAPDQQPLADKSQNSD